MRPRFAHGCRTANELEETGKRKGGKPKEEKKETKKWKMEYNSSGGHSNNHISCVLCWARHVLASKFICVQTGDGGGGATKCELKSFGNKSSSILSNRQQNNSEHMRMRVKEAGY